MDSHFANHPETPSSHLYMHLWCLSTWLFLWSCLLSAVWTRAWREQSSLVSASGCREHPWRLPMPMGEHVSAAESSNIALLSTYMAKCADRCSCPPTAHQVPPSHSQKASAGLYLTAWRVQCGLSRWQEWSAAGHLQVEELKSLVLHVS